MSHIKGKPVIPALTCEYIRTESQGKRSTRPRTSWLCSCAFSDVDRYESKYGS